MLGWDKKCFINPATATKATYCDSFHNAWQKQLFIKWVSRPQPSFYVANAFYKRCSSQTDFTLCCQATTQSAVVTPQSKNPRKCHGMWTSFKSAMSSWEIKNHGLLRREHNLSDIGSFRQYAGTGWNSEVLQQDHRSEHHSIRLWPVTMLDLQRFLLRELDQPSSTLGCHPTCIVWKESWEYPPAQEALYGAKGKTKMCPWSSGGRLDPNFPK